MALVRDPWFHDALSSPISCSSDYRLCGHAKEGYGLAWSPKEAGLLASGADDSSICIWDLRQIIASPGSVSLLISLSKRSRLLPQSTTKDDAQRRLNPNLRMSGHEKHVEDISFHYQYSSVLASCSDDSTIMIWDTRDRQTASAPVDRWRASAVSVNSVAFSPEFEFLVLSASNDGAVRLWDLRCTRSAVSEFACTSQPALSVSWCPNKPTVFASSGMDRRIYMWDLARASEAPQNAIDGPAELIFMHGGHTDRISDISWNPSVDNCIASVSEDNILQIFKVADSAVIA